MPYWLVILLALSGSAILGLIVGMHIVTRITGRPADPDCLKRAAAGFNRTIRGR